MILRSSDTNDIPFQTSGFFFKPCPLPHLMCSNRSVLCFCNTFSKCFLGLAPLLYCYTPRTYFTHLGSFLIRQDTWWHITQQFCPGHLYKTVRLSNINNGSMFLSPCASLSGKVHKLCGSRGSSHEILIVSSSQTVSFLLQWLQFRFGVCCGSPESFSLVFTEVIVFLENHSVHKSWPFPLYYCF